MSMETRWAYPREQRSRSSFMGSGPLFVDFVWLHVKDDFRFMTLYRV
jgi:hypothetical protein